MQFKTIPTTSTSTNYINRKITPLCCDLLSSLCFKGATLITIYDNTNKDNLDGQMIAHRFL